MLATILISILLIVVVGLVIASMVRRKKRGESIVGCSECGGACSGCAMGGICHGNPDAKAPEKL